jgi:long-chain fatty acid transport protein
VKTRFFASALALCASAAPVASAWAGGMYLPTRGVRPTGRGGAFIAGADDLSATWLNPAGLAHLDSSAFLADATFVHQSISYDRIDSGGNVAATVENEAPGVPVPSLGYVRPLGGSAVLAFGVSAPYAGLAKFSADGAQRYSSIDLSKSIIATVGMGVAVRLGSRLRIGATFQNHVTALQNEIALSGCPGETTCAPEDPEFDAITRVDQDDFFNPSGSVGLQFDVVKSVTFGAAFQLPVWFRGHGTLHTRLPSSGFFDGASVEGDRADIAFDLPAEVRAGIEFHRRSLSVELATTVQLWSQHDAMRIEPIGVRIVDAPGVGTYEFGPMTVQRNFKDTYAVHLGVEQAVGERMQLRGGYAYETGAPPDEYLSVLTVDGQKHMVTGGLGYRDGAWSFDAVAGFAMMAERQVEPTVGVAPQLNPIRDPSTTPLTTFVNWGDYRSSWLLFGLGVQRAL